MAEDPPPQPSPAPWRRLSSREVLINRWLQVHADRIVMPDGREVDPFFRIVEPDWSCAIPVLPDGRIVMVEQYRHGIGRICLEFPAGDLERGEAPAACARRECAEETGYHASAAPQHVGSCWVEPARHSTQAHCWLFPVAAAPQRQELDDTEAVAVRLLELRELSAAITAGRFVHGIQIGFLALARLRKLLQ